MNIRLFEQYFKGVSGFQPYQWQTDLYEQFLAGNFPTVSIPTGLGKTSIMLVWLLALAERARLGESLARRLVYVVDRRTIVDQSTAVAESIKAWLDSPENDKHPVVSALKQLSLLGQTGRSPLAISTLRGQHADNGAWRVDPSRPAIIIGTVDMIGSRLLFSGYGDGRSRRPMHAGLLGADALIVHDEAHLSPAFGHLCRQIMHQQAASIGAGLPGLRLLEMSATHHAAQDNVLPLPESDRTDSRVAKRLTADKRLSIKRLPETATPADKRQALVDAALAHAGSGKTVLVYVVSPDDAGRIAKAIEGGDKQSDVLTLTGTMRGAERDGLVGQPAYQRFAPMDDTVRQADRDSDRTTYLVSTSAGEVGVDLDADVGVFDLTTIESFVQRAGRINRSGGRSAPISLIVAPKTDLESSKSGLHAQRRLALQLLECLPVLDDSGDARQASPAALTELCAREDYPLACRPPPRLRRLEPWLLDTWSMTSRARGLGPEVAPWLRGITDYDPPQTTLVWRDIDAVVDADERTIEAWIGAWPVLARECATLPSNTARKFLADLAGRLAKQVTEGGALPRLIVLSAQGAATARRVSDLEKTPRLLNNATVVLPHRVGGLLPGGQPDATAKPPSVSLDVSSLIDAGDATRERWMLQRDGEGWLAHGPPGVEDLQFADDIDGVEPLLEALENQRGLKAVWQHAPHVPVDGEEPSEVIAYLECGNKPRFPESDEFGAQSSRTQLLDEHSQRVGQYAAGLAAKTLGDRQEADCLAAAGHAHDTGKNRLLWQLAAGNKGQRVLAKCYGRQANWRKLNGYRHEFGSMMDLLRSGHATDNLTLHLVASHHGFARPFFTEAAFDPNVQRVEDNEAAARDAALRFEALQRHYGWWGLAYLEALLKAADVMGSMDKWMPEEQS